MMLLQCTNSNTTTNLHPSHCSSSSRAHPSACTATASSDQDYDYEEENTKDPADFEHNTWQDGELQDPDEYTESAVDPDVKEESISPKSRRLSSYNPLLAVGCGLVSVA